MAFKHGAAPVFLSFRVSTDFELFNFATPPFIPSTVTLASEPSPSGTATFCRKRARPLADIDGCCREVTKKRRLRLTFVTSRLSDPFASPPTNNVDRGNCKMASWARQKCIPASTQLRKAAILNRIKREAMAAREAQQRQIELARQQYCQQQLALAQAAPQRSSKRIQARKAKNNKQKEISKKVLTPDSSPEEPKKQSIPRVFKPVPIAPAPPDHCRSLPLVVPIYHRPPTPPNEAEIEQQIKLVKQKTRKGRDKGQSVENSKPKRVKRKRTE